MLVKIRKFTSTPIKAHISYTTILPFQTPWPIAMGKMQSAIEHQSEWDQRGGDNNL
jgi:hypothetical protein